MMKLLKNDLIKKIIRFGIVGGLAFVIDFSTMVLCHEVFHISVLVSTTIGFIVSVIFNYILSVTWVFDVDPNKSKRKNFVLFIVFSIIGLILNDLIMWLGSYIIGISYIIVKVIATGIVMVFNFITRKIFLE